MGRKRELADGLNPAKQSVGRVAQFTRERTLAAADGQKRSVEYVVQFAQEPLLHLKARGEASGISSVAYQYVICKYPPR